MKDFKDLDAAIVDHISSSSLHPIYSAALLRAAAALLGEPESPQTDKQWRLIDRRLQSMRKAGKLKYDRKVDKGHGQWKVVAADAN